MKMRGQVPSQSRAKQFQPVDNQPQSNGAVKPADAAAGAEVKARSTKPHDERPYLWASKLAVEAISNSPHVTRQAWARLVYFTLCQISNSQEFKGAPTFQVTKWLISNLSGLSVRTVFDALAELHKTRVIHIDHHYDPVKKKHDASTYTIISFSKRTYGANNHTPSGAKNRRGMAREGASRLPTVIVKGKKLSTPKGVERVSFPGSSKNRKNQNPALSLDGSAGFDSAVTIKVEQSGFYDVARAIATAKRLGSELHGWPLKEIESITSKPCRKCGVVVQYLGFYCGATFKGKPLCSNCRKEL